MDKAKNRIENSKASSMAPGIAQGPETPVPDITITVDELLSEIGTLNMRLKKAQQQIIALARQIAAKDAEIQKLQETQKSKEK